jgi:hypothetical protein
MQGSYTLPEKNSDEKHEYKRLQENKERGTLNIVTPEVNLPKLRSFLNENQINARILLFS